MQTQVVTCKNTTVKINNLKSKSSNQDRDFSENFEGTFLI